MCPRQAALDFSCLCALREEAQEVLILYCVVGEVGQFSVVAIATRFFFFLDTW